VELRLTTYRDRQPKNSSDHAFAPPVSPGRMSSASARHLDFVDDFYSPEKREVARRMLYQLGEQIDEALGSCRSSLRRSR
jgi:hypothetical protein